MSLIIALPEFGVAIGRMVLCTKITNGIPLTALTTPYCFVRGVSIAVASFVTVGVIVDTYIYSIAFVRLRELHVSRSKKIQLILIFAVGFM